MSTAKDLLVQIKRTTSENADKCPECGSTLGKQIGDKPRTCIKCGEKIDGEEEHQKEAINVLNIIKELIATSFGGSNESQGKAVQLLKGLAFSDDPKSNAFMKDLDKLTSSMDPKKYE